MIYIVDDTEDYRFLLKQFFKLTRPDDTLTFFPDGDLLCQQAQRPDSDEQRTERPDLILLDFHMPKLNGLQTLDCLNRFPSWQRVPVIMLSSTTDQEEIDACYAAGVKATVHKSAILTKLNLTIQAVLAA